MLVLSRRFGEKLIIGKNIEICVLGINEFEVRLEIKAPHEITVRQGDVAQELSNSSATQPVAARRDAQPRQAQPSISYLRRRKRT